MPLLALYSPSNETQREGWPLRSGQLLRRYEMNMYQTCAFLYSAWDSELMHYRECGAFHLELLDWPPMAIFGRVLERLHASGTCKV
jgi:hypothetical protein